MCTYVRLHKWLFTTWKPGVCRNWKRPSDPQELEFQVFVNYHVDAENCKNSQCSTLQFLRHSLSLNLRLTDWLDWWSIKPHRCPFLFSITSIMDIWCQLWLLYVVAGYLCSRLYGCAATILTTERLLQVLYMIFFSFLMLWWLTFIASLGGLWVL